MISFFHYTKSQIQDLIQDRAGEEKLGKYIQVLSSLEALNTCTANFVIIGAKEDVGVKANYGIGGTGTAWEAFLRSFLNIQHNQFLQGQDVAILGHWSVNQGVDKECWEGCIQDLDMQISNVVQQIIAMGKIPILIGGGHNNAYGMIKGASQAFGKPVSVINCDPHADLRKTEGRHSGNGFSYAKENGYLHRYALLGLHQNYNNQFMLDTIQVSNDYKAIYFEDIFVHQNLSWNEAVGQQLRFVNALPFGVELDIDALQNVLSSALTPVGISPIHAMQFLHQSAQKESVYLHIAEAVSYRADGVQQATVGKLLSYLVQSFVKSKNSIMSYFNNVL